jgi:hypothetical protein
MLDEIDQQLGIRNTEIELLKRAWFVEWIFCNARNHLSRAFCSINNRYFGFFAAEYSKTANNGPSNANSN